MNKGQISAADEPEAKKSFEKFIGWVKQNLALEKDLVVRWSARSVWTADVFYQGQPKIGAIDLSLPLELQAYQLGQIIGKLKR